MEKDKRSHTKIINLKNLCQIRMINWKCLIDHVLYEKIKIILSISLKIMKQVPDNFPRKNICKQNIETSITSTLHF